MTRTARHRLPAAIAAAAVLGFAFAAGASTDDLKPGASVGSDEAALRASLAEKGWDVRKVEREDGMIEAYALKDGRRYEIYVDPKTGRIVRVKEDDDAAAGPEAVTEAGAEAGAAPGPERVRGWDLGVRLGHWSLAAVILLNLVVLDEEGRAHEIAGWAALAIVGWRLVWGLAGPTAARFTSFPPSLSAARDHLYAILDGRGEAPHRSHNPLGALMVYNLLVTVALIGATGGLMTTDAFWGVEWIEELHEALADWLSVSIVLHIAGVVLESVRGGRNLVRAMIDGRPG